MVDDWFQAFINDVLVAQGDKWWVLHRVTITSTIVNLDPWKNFILRVEASNNAGPASIAYLLREDVSSRLVIKSDTLGERFSQGNVFYTTADFFNGFPSIGVLGVWNANP